MATPLRSMTGFGEAEQSFPFGRLRVEVRTGNHRHLNVQLRTPQPFERHQRAIEGVLRERFLRGNVQLILLLEVDEHPTGAPPRFDVDRARAFVEGVRALQAELQLPGEVDLSVLAWHRDLLRESATEETPIEVGEEELLGLIREGVSRVLAMREEEGRRLAQDLQERAAHMEEVLDAMARRAPERLIAERDRLRTAIQELLGGDLTVDEERLAREVAHLAERWDIHEELVRFRSHLEHVRTTLSEGDPAGVGKRLGFIAQELLREANTVGSKANDALIARGVLQLKEEIDRVREQVENLE